MRNTKEIRNQENIVFQTRPRFLMNLKSAILKFIVILVILYFFADIRNIAFTVQQYLVGIIQIPLVEGVTILVMLIILILFLWIIWNLLSWRFTLYTLTEQRIVVERGMLRKNRNSIHYDKIQDVTVSQSLIERLTLSGDIEVFGGHDSTRIFLEDVPRPKDIEEMINKMIEGDPIFQEPKKGRKPKKKPNNRDLAVKRHNEKFRRE